MENQQKKEFVEQAKSVRQKCYWMLENAPQKMSNVSPILEILAAVNRLIASQENE